MTHVIDSSALVAHVRQEPGSVGLAPIIRGGLLSCVNLAEVIAILLRLGTAFDRARKIVELSEVQVVAFDSGLAEAASQLIQRTRRQGLSLGDCACLALAKRENLPALTADGAWRDLDIGVEIRFIR